MPNSPLNDLARVRAAFDQWRSLGSKRGRIPEHLWQAAISLLDRHTQSHICRELRLTARELRRRSCAGSQAADAHSFVELPALIAAPQPPVHSPAQPAQPHQSVRFVLERPDGSRLTCWLAPADSIHLATLAASFLER